MSTFNTIVSRIINFYVWLSLYLLNRFVDVKFSGYLFGHYSLMELGIDEASKFEERGEATPPNFNKTLNAEGLKNGSLRWFSEIHDRKPTDPVLLFLHGGGYAWGCSKSHAELIAEIYRRLPTCHRMSIVWLDYTLSTDSPFPQQIAEAASAYNALLKSTSNILLFGDSAGANLCVNLLRHIHKPFSGVPKISKNIKPSASLLLSPWLILHVDGDKLPSNSSFIRYAYNDTLTINAINSFGRLVLNDFQNDELTKEFVATFNDTSVNWKHIFPVATRTLVAYGERDILRDSIETFLTTTTLEVRGASVIVTQDGKHDGDYHHILNDILGFLKTVLPSGSAQDSSNM